MGWSNGRLTQQFKAEVDIEKLMEYLTDSILSKISDDPEIDYVELDEWYFDDNNLVIDGSYGADFRSYYAPETRYEPSEYEEERPHIGDTDGEWMLNGLPEEMRKLVKIKRITEDEDKCEMKYNGEDY